VANLNTGLIPDPSRMCKGLASPDYM